MKTESMHEGREMDKMKPSLDMKGVPVARSDG
jgi:hypothetical protein